MTYLRDPEAITEASFAAIRKEVDLSRLPPELHGVALRLVHACGMPDIVDELAWSGDPSAAARSALAEGAPLLVDARMVAAGIMAARLPAENRILCTLAEPGVTEESKRRGWTRSAAAVELWRPHLAGAVVAIGNAPTALFRLLEMLEEASCPRPAVLFAFPVGFIGAAESKEALIAAETTIPFLTLRGRRGGSALATAAVNATLSGPSR